MRCFLDVSISGELEGRIVVELFPDIVPKTSENFRALCTGEKGISPHTGVPLHFKGTPFHRVMKGCIIEGGDISNHDGSGGESIYGLTFEDENFKMKHERRGILSMVNSGPNTNGSKFSIISKRASYMDGKNVAFGMVVKGRGVLRAIEHAQIHENGVPMTDIVIEDCGEIVDGADDGVINFFKDGDQYLDWPGDLDELPANLTWWVASVESAKKFGNQHFKKGDYRMAIRKYRKALHYLDYCWDKEEIYEDKLDQLRKIKCQILSNSSVCKLKLGDAKGALIDSEYAIHATSNNSKAFFRQGQAHLALNNLEAALSSFTTALQFSPNDVCIKKEIAIVKRKIGEKREVERKAFSRMFK